MKFLIIAIALTSFWVFTHNFGSAEDIASSTDQTSVVISK